MPAEYHVSMNVTIRATPILLILFLAACTDVVHVEPPEGDISAQGWGTADPNARNQPPGSGLDEEGGEDWSTIDDAPGADGGDDPTMSDDMPPETGEGSSDESGAEPSDALCGDGACTGGETCLTCPEDCGQTCPPGTCGDNICDGDNTCETCPEDCGVCGVASCGNGACDNGETCNTCALDCGACPEATCGDGICAVGEDCQGCAVDCGACPLVCGDGVCAEGEACETCVEDCGECAECCDTAFCHPLFEECKMAEDGEGCFCDPIYEICAFVGDNCPVGYEQPEPFTCIDYGGADGLCREKCVGPSLGDPDPCEGEQWLCGALPGMEGYCVPASCTGYFDNDFGACGPDATCLPLVNGENTCVPDGPDDEGEACAMHNECGHGMLCIDNFCSFGECSVDSNQVPCAGAGACLAWTVGVDELSVGNCAAECAVFTDEGCENDEWCFPLPNVPEEGPIDGYCIPIDDGYLFEGVECDLDPNGCMEGTMCVLSPDNAKASCEPLCYPSAPAGQPGSCSPGRGCSPLFLQNEYAEVVEVMDYGSCIPACTPWVDQGISGCGGDSWCQPMLFNSHAGECKGVLGQLSEGEACSEVGLQNSCGVGLFCLGFMTSAGMDGVCHRLCDADGGPGDTCAADQMCDPIEFTGADDKEIEIAVGVCIADPMAQDDPDGPPEAPPGDGPPAEEP